MQNKTSQLLANRELRLFCLFSKTQPPVHLTGGYDYEKQSPAEK